MRRLRKINSGNIPVGSDEADTILRNCVLIYRHSLIKNASNEATSHTHPVAGGSVRQPSTRLLRRRRTRKRVSHRPSIRLFLRPAAWIYHAGQFYRKPVQRQRCHLRRQQYRRFLRPGLSARFQRLGLYGREQVQEITPTQTLPLPAPGPSFSSSAPKMGADIDGNFKPNMVRLSTQCHDRLVRVFRIGNEAVSGRVHQKVHFFHGNSAQERFGVIG